MGTLKDHSSGGSNVANFWIGVNTKIAFYENAYHGVSQMLHLRTAQDMLDDLVTHIKQTF